MADRALKQYIVRMRDGVNVNVEAVAYAVKNGTYRFAGTEWGAEIARFEVNAVSAVFEAPKQNVVTQ